MPARYCAMLSYPLASYSVAGGNSGVEIRDDDR